MKLLVLVAVCLVAVATAAPQYDGVKVLQYDNDNIGVGNYRFVLEQSDGSKQEQFGELKDVNQLGRAVAVKGSYSWTAPDNVNYVVTYVADENGYRSTISKSRHAVL